MPEIKLDDRLLWPSSIAMVSGYVFCFVKSLFSPPSAEVTKQHPMCHYGWPHGEPRTIGRLLSVGQTGGTVLTLTENMK